MPRDKKCQCFQPSLANEKAWRLRHSRHLLVEKVSHFTRPPGSRLQTSRKQISWGCKGLLMAKKLLHDNCKWKAGDDTLIIAATDYWVNGNKAIFRDNLPLAAVTQLQVAHLILPG